MTATSDTVSQRPCVFIVMETVDPSEPFELGGVFGSLESALDAVREGYTDDLDSGDVELHVYEPGESGEVAHVVWGNGESVLCTVTRKEVV